MDVIRSTKPQKPSEDQDGPFRPLYVESEEVNVRYKLNKEEVRAAILQWLENEHEISDASGELVAVIPETKNQGGNMITNLLDKYDLAIDVEIN